MGEAFFLFGPTGSGKTARVLDLATQWQGMGCGVEVINADSRQVYRGIGAIAACPTEEEKGGLPHHLYEFLEVNQRYSAGAYARDARKVVEDVLARGNIPLVVGGTGFYLRALEGLDAVPEVPDEVVRRFGGNAVELLWRDVQRVDPDWAAAANASDRANPQRLQRVLAVAAHTGRPLSFWQRQEGAGLGVPVVKWYIDREEHELARRLRARAEAMAPRAVAEARAMLEAGAPADAPGLQALAFDFWAAAAKGEKTVEEAVAATARMHAQYAKRQRTWLRTQYGGVPVPDRLPEKITDEAPFA